MEQNEGKINLGISTATDSVIRLGNVRMSQRDLETIRLGNGLNGVDLKKALSGDGYLAMRMLCPPNVEDNKIILSLHPDDTEVGVWAVKINTCQ